METIASFCVDHDLIEPGMYISRIDGDVVTYDLRTRRPNGGDYMSHLTMHSVEHMLATLLRNGPLGDRVIYFGPMGCQTGFYLLMRDSVSAEAVYREVCRALAAVGEEPKMFGQEKRECGNYLNLSLDAAKVECAGYLACLVARGPHFEYEKGDKA